MTVAHLYRVVQDSAGNVVPGAQVSLCDPGSTDALITDLVYSDQQLTTKMTNPFTTPNGVIDIYLARPRTVTLKTIVRAVTLYVDYVDVLPAAENILAAMAPVVIDNAAFAGGILHMSDATTAEWADAATIALTRTIGPTELLLNPQMTYGSVYTDPDPSIGTQFGGTFTAQVDCLLTDLRYYVPTRGGDGMTLFATIYDDVSHVELARGTRNQLESDPVGQFVVIPLEVPLALPAGQVIAATVFIPGGVLPVPVPPEMTFLPPEGEVIPIVPITTPSSVQPSMAYRTSSAGIAGAVLSLASGNRYAHGATPQWPEANDATKGCAVDLVAARYIIGSPVGGDVITGSTTSMTATSITSTKNGTGSSVATATGAIAIGGTAQASAPGAIAIGSGSRASGVGSVAVGVDHTGLSANATGQDDFVLGTSNHKVHIDGTVGFFGATPVGRRPSPTTLADVIAGLRALGLFQ